MSETGMILVFIGIFLAGGLIGFAIYHLSLGKKRAGTKQQELDDTKAELEQYKEKVNHHFMNSAELMQQVATSYQALHSHMANDSESLLGEHGPSVYPLLGAAAPNALAGEDLEAEPLSDTNNTADEEVTAQSQEVNADTNSQEGEAKTPEVEEKIADKVDKPLDYADDKPVESEQLDSASNESKETVSETTDAVDSSASTQTAKEAVNDIDTGKK